MQLVTGSLMHSEQTKCDNTGSAVSGPAYPEWEAVSFLAVPAGLQASSGVADRHYQCMTLTWKWGP